MDRHLRVAVIIPTLDEAAAIGAVLAAIPRHAVDRMIVADSGSSDRTVERARAAGAEIVTELRRGYGRACLAGAIAANDCDILVFLDGDGSDPAERIPALLEPIADGRYDFVIGSRTRGRREPGSMSAHQIIAGHAVGLVLRLRYGVGYTDMGPFRAIRRQALGQLGMREMTFGWNLEMQMRAARAGLRILEIPVEHRRRIGGASKVSGSVAGTIRASLRIGATLTRIACEGHPR
ncbi:MAG: glycosyltransferase family 2 protein [Stellaceae bacterium]